MRITIILPLILLLSPFVFGQGVDKNDGNAFELPSNYITVLLINSPDCPIQLEGSIKVIGWPYGALSLYYNIQNVSGSNVKSFVIKETNWFGSHGHDLNLKMKKNFFFVPLMTMSSQDEEDFDNLGVFDEKRAEKLIRLSNRIWIAMVVKVKLSDGTTYDASKKYDRLTKFIDTTDWETFPTANELDNRERNLREFVSKLGPSED